MKITEVRVTLVKGKDDRLKAYCSITLDNEFVVRDIKVIGGTNGLFIAMPSRKMSDHCAKCGGKSHLRAKFCNSCGAPLPGDRAETAPDGRSKFHADIAHPINVKCRQSMQQKIVGAFRGEEIDAARLQAHPDRGDGQQRSRHRRVATGLPPNGKPDSHESRNWALEDFLSRHPARGLPGSPAAPRAQIGRNRGRPQLRRSGHPAPFPAPDPAVRSGCIGLG